MKKIFITSILLAMFLFSLSCSKKESPAYSRVAGIAYEDSDNQVTSVFKNRANTYGGTSQADMPEAAPMLEAANPADSNSANFSNVERKLVKRANINIRVENLEKADADIAELLEKYDAYAASTNIEENSYFYSLRVPSPVYDTFLAEMNGLGRLLRRSESTEDVTLRYYDLEGRLATKKELLKTFQDYLRKAKTIEEILSVEARISDLQYDIEGTGIQLRNLANRVDYATVDLSLLGPVTSTPYRSATLGERVKQMFGNFGGFLSTVMIAIIGVVIYGIPIFILIAVLFWLLFGRIGLLKKLWQLVMAKKQG